MKLSALSVGDAVSVRIGYSVRPATINSLLCGRVGVTWEDIDRNDPAISRIAFRYNLFGAVVLPQFVQPR